MLCLSGFELYSRWVPLFNVSVEINFEEYVVIEDVRSIQLNKTGFDQNRNSVFVMMYVS